MSLQAIVCRWVHAYQQNCLLLGVLLLYSASKLACLVEKPSWSSVKGAVEWSSKQLLFEVPRALHMTWTSRYLFIASFNSYFDRALGYFLYSFVMHYRAVGHSLLCTLATTWCNYMRLLYVLYCATTLCIAKCLVPITCLAMTWTTYLETLHKVGGFMLTYHIC